MKWQAGAQAGVGIRIGRLMHCITRWDVGYLHWDGVLEYAYGDEKRITASQLRIN
jgi:hypothetical protein